MKWIKLNRNKIKVYGKKGKVLPKGMLEEHLSFLQSTLTNDIVSLKDGQFNYNLWLTGNGQPREDFFVFKEDGHFILDCDEHGEEVIKQFNKLKLSLQVYFEDLTQELPHIFVFGDGCEDFIKDMFNQEIEKFTFKNLNGTYVANNPLRIGETGFDIFGDISKVGEYLNPSDEISIDDFEDIRIENCVPKIHKELRERFHPLEANIADYAFSFTKGCYIGQEAIARVYFRGRTPRTLAKFQLEGTVKENDEIFSSQDKKIGVITSVNSNHKIGLGYILRNAVQNEKEFKTSEGKVIFINECLLKI